MGMGSHSGMISTEENSWFFHQSSLAVLPAELCRSKQKERAKEKINLALRIIFVRTSQVIFTCPKNYGMGPTPLLPLRTKASEVYLLKIHCLELQSFSY
jgi:hypothetical protein